MTEAQELHKKLIKSYLENNKEVEKLKEPNEEAVAHRNNERKTSQIS